MLWAKNQGVLAEPSAQQEDSVGAKGCQVRDHCQVWAAPARHEVVGKGGSCPRSFPWNMFLFAVSYFGVGQKRDVGKSTEKGSGE